jgi:lipopolysaccharide export system protein LptA
MAAKYICRALLLAAGLLAGCGRESSVAPAPTPPQNAPPQTEGAFRRSVYYDAPYFKLKKMEITGRTDASALSQNGLLIKDVQIDSFRLMTNDPANATNAPEMTVTAPECLIDKESSSGSSAGPMTARTADGRFLIEGTGYLWQSKGTNATLTISNNVSTTVKNDLLATNDAGSVSPDNGGHYIHIHSHSFRFDRNANLITYRDQVHVEDEQLALDCDIMNIQRATNGPISSLVADGHIAVADKFTGGRTTGEHAVYTGDAGAQIVTLTGNPYWRNGPQEATAQAFVFDKSRQTFRAEGDAHFRLPAGSLTGSGFIFTPQAAAAAKTPQSETNLVDLYAAAVTMILPETTNGPIQRVIAETNVVITNAPDNSWATGDRATYSGLDGVLTLSGRAQWQSDRGVARAETLTFDRTNLAFAALTNAYLKFPVAALNESPGFGNFKSSPNLETTNRFMEVTSDSYDYRENALTFRRQVHASLIEENAPLGSLDSGILTVGFRDTNVLRSIVAEDDVHLRQPPTRTTSGKTVESDVTCARVEILMRTNGLLESAVATGRVLGSRTETSPSNPNPVHLTLAADSLNASFMPDTNAIQTLVADRNVVLTHNDEKASGEKIVYTATNDIAVLTGHPKLEQPQGQMTGEDAILYDHHAGMITGQGNPDTQILIPETALTDAGLPTITEKRAKPK